MPFSMAAWSEAVYAPATGAEWTESVYEPAAGEDDNSEEEAFLAFLAHTQEFKRRRDNNNNDDDGDASRQVKTDVSRPSDSPYVEELETAVRMRFREHAKGAVLWPAIPIRFA